MCACACEYRCVCVFRLRWSCPRYKHQLFFWYKHRQQIPQCNYAWYSIFGWNQLVNRHQSKHSTSVGGRERWVCPTDTYVGIIRQHTPIIMIFRVDTLTSTDLRTGYVPFRACHYQQQPWCSEFERRSRKLTVIDIIQFSILIGKCWRVRSLAFFNHSKVNVPI